MLTTIPAGDSDELPVLHRPDGGDYPFLMLHGEEFTGADSRTELVGAMLPGYADLPDSPQGDDEAIQQRWEQAVATATEIQTGLLAGAAATGGFDPATIGEDALTAMFQDKDVPFTGLPLTDPGTAEALSAIGDQPSEPPVTLRWPENLPPLVLVATDYAPYTTAPRPHGNVLMLDPHTETTWLDSLATLGLIQMWLAQPAV
jgi:hypothetical protein